MNQNISFFDPYFQELRRMKTFQLSAISASYYSQQVEEFSKLPIEFQIVDKETHKLLHDFSLGENEKGFPFLHKLLCIRLWSLMEQIIDDYFLSYSPDKRSLKRFKSKHKSSIGIDRFESILSEINAINTDNRTKNEFVKKKIKELSQIRNVLVHNDGKADQKLINNCEWLDYSIGEEVIVNNNMFTVYLCCVHWYIAELSRKSVENESIEINDINAIKEYQDKILKIAYTKMA